MDSPASASLVLGLQPSHLSRAQQIWIREDKSRKQELCPGLWKTGLKPGAVWDVSERYSPTHTPELQFLLSQGESREGHGLDRRELRLSMAATRCHYYFMQEVAEPALSVSLPAPDTDAPCCKGPAKGGCFLLWFKILPGSLS